MSTQSTRTVIDLDPPAPARPGVALALALLTVPGVLITWDVVPGGGFTTGVPLGIAAIVIGLQARARLNGAKGTKMAQSAIGVASLAVLSVAFFTIAGSPDSKAQAPTTRTILVKELEKGSTFKQVANTRSASGQALATADLIVFTNPLADAAGKRVGKLYVTCTTTVGNKSFLKATLTCTAVMTVADGSLSVVTNTSPGSTTTTGAVVGGTGVYAAAQGVLVSKRVKGGSDDTITLAS